MAIAIDVPRGELAAFCQRHYIRRLALFGSVLRDDFGPASDVDVLVEFEPGHVPGFAFAGMADELSLLFGGRYVDLKTPACFRPQTLEKVLSEALLRYGTPFRRPRPAAAHSRDGRKGAPLRKRKKAS